MKNINYLRNITMKEYLQSDNYKTAKKLIELCGTENKIIDIGCGSGFIAKILNDNGNEVIGFDMLDSCINETRKKGVFCWKADAKDLPIDNQCADIVIMSEVLEHLLETQEVLAEARRVLKKGGRIIITTPNFCSFRDRILVMFGHLQAYSQHSDHIKFFNKERLVREFKQAGFKHMNIYGSGFGVPFPKNAITTFYYDNILPPTLTQTLILEAKK
jgi:ubiquinone/menaquinone biosynthesis C-methylase UbiE